MVECVCLSIEHKENVLVAMEELWKFWIKDSILNSPIVPLSNKRENVFLSVPSSFYAHILLQIHSTDKMNQFFFQKRLRPEWVLNTLERFSST